MTSINVSRETGPVQPGGGIGVVVLLALLVLSFAAGAFVTLAKVFPYRNLSDAYRAGKALMEQTTAYDTPYGTTLWVPARGADRGVTIHEPGRAYDGLTLYSSSHSQDAVLLSMSGEVVHTWDLRYSRIWDESAEIARPRPDDFIFLYKLHVFANGDLLAVYDGVGDTPWGYGLVKVDKDSRVIWKYLARAHHDFDIADDGRIFALTHEIREDAIPGHDNLEPPWVDDFVVVLSPDGKPLAKVSIVEAFARSPYARLLATAAPNEGGDYLHTNSIDLIDAAEASRLPFASGGEVVVSIRELATIAVLNLDREEIVWALRGPWGAQHDSDVLPNGNILLFDNRGRVGPGGRSRVIEFDPSTLKTVWEYAGDERHFFDSEIRSGQQRLANGNTLITESDGGRLFEVTPQKDIVWEFVNPVRGGEDGELIPVVSAGMRIGRHELEPGFVDR